jgi:hypothetical protein
LKTFRQDLQDLQDLQEGYGSGPAVKTGIDCLEGQRPRLTHFSATGGADFLSDRTLVEFTTERLKQVWTEFTEFSEL